MPIFHCSAILFDLDGVLVDSTGSVDRQWRAWARTKGIDGDKVMVRWRFTFTPGEGPPMVMEEIALQRWAGDRIAEERFFYDSRQTRPEAPG